MKRELEKQLVQWRKNTGRQPLFVQGCRGVGKTTLIREFAGQHFEKVREISLCDSPKILRWIKKGDAGVHTVAALESLLNAGPFTERQVCFVNGITGHIAQALALVRFLKQGAGVPVIVEGTPLDFATVPDPAMFATLTLKPLTFHEFLMAKGQGELALFLGQLRPQSRIGEALHLRCLSLFRDYLFVGGMPEAVASHVRDPFSPEYQEKQRAINQAFFTDLIARTRRPLERHVQLILASLPQVVGKRFRYAAVSRDIQSRELKTALTTMIASGQLLLINEKAVITAGSQPITGPAFKILYHDVGLLVNLGCLEPDLAFCDNPVNFMGGLLVRQCVGQELFAAPYGTDPQNPSYWRRHKRGSSAEVDFLIDVDHLGLPLVINQRKSGWLKALKIYLEENPVTPFGIRLSLDTPSYQDGILTLPLYAAGQVRRMIREVGSRKFLRNQETFHDRQTIERHGLSY